MADSPKPVQSVAKFAQVGMELILFLQFFCVFRVNLWLFFSELARNYKKLARFLRKNFHKSLFYVDVNYENKGLALKGFAFIYGTRKTSASLLGVSVPV
jgi:hypothetical protein